MIDTDWLVLRGLVSSLSGAFSKYVDRGTRLLDFGCGTMPYRSMVEARGGKYVGADFGSDAAIEITPDGQVGANDGSIDVVLSVQVLEHVRDLDRYFSEISRVLDQGGRLILSTHGTWLYHPHPEDHRRWTRMGLHHEIESRGFKIESSEAIVGPLAWTTMIRSTGFAFALRNIPLVGRLLQAVVSLVMNMRAWAEDAITPEAIRTENACVYLVVATKRESAS